MLIAACQYFGGNKGKGQLEQLALLKKMAESTGEDEVIIGTTTHPDQTPEADAYFQCGGKKKIFSSSIQACFDKTLDSGKPVLLRDATVLRDMARNSGNIANIFPRLAWNDLCAVKGIYPFDHNYDRWKQLARQFNIEVHDWKRRGDVILVALQIPTDFSLNEINFDGPGYLHFMTLAIQELLDVTDRKIILRPHPSDKGNSATKYLMNIFTNNPRVMVSKIKDLYEDLNRSWCLLCYNSISCVEATLYGTPVIALGKSAVSNPVSQHSVKEIENVHEPDRKEWCNRIAFYQWTNEELADVSWQKYIWSLLRKCISNNKK